MSITFGDKSHARLRELTAAVDTELAAGNPSTNLRTSWGELVALLALGSAPELRACPNCGELAMRAATRCSRCWSSLTPE
jgi:hypothetical protein